MAENILDGGTAGESETRKLAAIMFTDMVGFSRLMHADEQNGLRLLDKCNEVIFAAVAQQGGNVLKKMGDAVLAEFSSASSAVKSAIEIQTRLRDYNAGAPEDSHIVLRIGVHLGDVVIRDQDLFGDGINVAARLEPLSEPGGICLSEAVYQAVASNSEIQPIRVGEVELKNILQKQVIYRIPSFYHGVAPHSVATDARHRTFDFGVIERVEELESPRSFRDMLFPTAVILFVVVVVACVVGFSLRPAYYIRTSDLLSPDSIIAALQQGESPAVRRVWESLDRETRALITGVDGSPQSGQRREQTRRSLRSALNDLILADERPLDAALLPGLEVQGLESDPQRLNRAWLELAFPGSIRRYLGEPSPLDAIREIPMRISYELALPGAGRWVTIAFLVIWPAYWILVSWAFSLLTVRISFKDIRDVDDLLDYHMREYGWRRAEDEGGLLVFRHPRLHFTRLRARVSGSQVILTGVRPAIRKLRKRILSFSERQSSSGAFRRSHSLDAPPAS